MKHLSENDLITTRFTKTKSQGNFLPKNLNKLKMHET